MKLPRIDEYALAPSIDMFLQVARQRIGTEPHTPLDVAVHKTLIGLGGLTDDRASGS